MTVETALNGLKRQRPEWKPWLAVVEEVLRDTEAAAWREAVPEVRGTEHAVPMLAGAALSMNPRPLRRLMEQLVRTAAHSGSAKLATLQAGRDLDAVALFRASLCHDAACVQEMAASTGANAEALQAVTALLSVPFLHACTREWSPAVPESWVEGYCPICASWPAFAEVRGIERNRYFRCGRCSAQWHSRALWCPYCSMDKHDELVSLVPERAGSQATIDACRRCRGYVKTFTRLQGCAAGTIMLEDLASVDLDIAAVEQDYTRPHGAGYPLGMSVTAADAPRRMFSWKHERN